MTFLLDWKVKRRQQHLGKRSTDISCRLQRLYKIIFTMTAFTPARNAHYDSSWLRMACCWMSGLKAVTPRFAVRL
ncbi:Uncharacterised protein [Serratia liquefaciens]|nr:Uncharacterised protein [Serratia liquefaciens]